MVRLDHSIGRVLRLLAASGTKEAGTARSARAAGAQSVRGGAARPDVDELRRRLRTQLRRLKGESPDYHDLAPEVVVREILVWEFGESIVGNSEFSNVVSQVVIAMKPNAAVSKNLRRLIAEMSAGPGS